MRLSIVVAMDRNRVIGQAGRLPWRLPADLRRFKRITMGKPIVMGRKTYESIGHPLPGRSNIVVTRDPGFEAQGFNKASSFEAALELARPADEVMIIGGTSLFEAALPRAERLYLTLIETSFDGDTWFPDYDPSQWHELSREVHPADDNNPYAHTFCILKRAS
jgi:dihydrofolate reductase